MPQPIKKVKPEEDLGRGGGIISIGPTPDKNVFTPSEPKTPLAPVPKIPTDSSGRIPGNTAAERFATANIDPNMVNDLRIAAELRQAYTNQKLAQEQQKLDAAKAQAGLPPAITPEQQQNAALLGTLTPEQQARQAITPSGAISKVATGSAGVAGAIGGGLAGAGTAAAIGAGIGLAGGPLAPATVPIGAAVGAIVGGVGAVYGKISVQKRQDVKEAYTVYTQAKSNMGWIINQANAGKLTPMQAHELWDEELANIYAADRGIKAQTKNDLNRFLSGGMDEKRKIDSFMARIPELQTQLEMAILAPNQNAAQVNLEEPTTTAE